MITKRFKFFVAILLSVAADSRLACAEVACSCTSGNPVVRVYVPGASPEERCFGSGEAISLSVAESWTEIHVYSLNSSSCGFANIGRITLSATSLNDLPTELKLLIGAQPDPTDFDDLDVAGVDWAGLDFGGAQGSALRDRTKLDGRIFGDLTDSVEVGRVNLLWIAGAVEDSIVVGDSTATALGRYRLGSMSTAGSLVSRTKSIVLLEIDGDCDGLVQAGLAFPAGTQDIAEMTIDGDFNGTIDVARYLIDLTVQGAIGSPTGLARIGVGVFLQELTCGELNADIGGFQGYPRADQIHNVSVITMNGGSGDFRGTILARDLMKYLTQAGRLRFDGQLLGIVQTNEGLLTADSTVEVRATGGMQGRVIIGANTSVQTWTWTSAIDIGATTIGSPNIPAYPNSAASLGGGSIGLVPFQLHATDCEPLNGDTLPYCEPPTEIRMRHYGPVTWDGENDPDPFIIERRRIDSTDSWVDHSDCFTQAIDSGDSAVVVLTPGVALQSGFDYRVRLRQDSGENVLRCDLLGIATLPEVADHASDFVFRAGVVGLGDANGDGIVNKDDHTCVNDNLYTTDCLNLGDANRDGTVDLDDRTCVTENWLNEYVMCPLPLLAMSSESSECERTMYDALIAMGFENAAEYIAFLGELSVEEQALILVAVDEWMECKR